MLQLTIRVRFNKIKHNRCVFRMPVPDPLSAAKLLRAMAPDWVWLLQHIESEDGYVRFPALFSRFVTNLNIGNYPELYESEVYIGAMMLRAFLDPEEIKELDAELVSLSPEGRADFLNEAIIQLTAAGEAI